MRQLFTILSKAPGAVLFHCSAGKDRTGAVVVVLYMIAKVKDCDIIADFQVAYTFIKDMIQSLKKYNPALPVLQGNPNQSIWNFLKGI